MGFFSWNCKGCGHPMLSEGATNEDNAWMQDVVAMLDNGSRVTGKYNGYGRADGQEMDPYGSSEVECWHKACWEKAERPEYTGDSEPAEDQGWFFEDGAHDMDEPIR